MAKYTMQLRALFEPVIFNPPLFTRNEVEGWFKDYNMFDYLTPEQVAVIQESNIWSKDRLAKKIVNHYYMEEIGEETPALFKHYAKVKMEELMEEYLPLIYSASIQYDPLVNVDFTESFEKARGENVDSSGTTTSNSNDITLNSDTPQKRVSKEDILSGAYVSETSGSEGEASSTSTGNSKTDETENYTKRVKGNSGVSATAQKMVQQYRDNIRAIDREIIEKLSSIFMGLW